jgi:hypothetical protein
MLVGAGLLLLGALVNALGIRNTSNVESDHADSRQIAPAVH